MVKQCHNQWILHINHPSAIMCDSHNAVCTILSVDFSLLPHHWAPRMWTETGGRLFSIWGEGSHLQCGFNHQTYSICYKWLQMIINDKFWARDDMPLSKSGDLTIKHRDSIMNEEWTQGLSRDVVPMNFMTNWARCKTINNHSFLGGYCTRLSDNMKWQVIKPSSPEEISYGQFIHIIYRDHNIYIHIYICIYIYIHTYIYTHMQV